MAVSLINELRKTGLWIEMDYLDRSLRAQMKSADRLNCNWVIIIGEDELAANAVKIRRMDTGSEDEVGMDAVIEYLMKHREENSNK